jgi:threonine dehydrogenase-like Zn-dependent dehydrogenase
VPGGQASYLPVPHAGYGLIKVPEGPADDRFLFLSDVLPTAWQAVEYAGVRPDDSLVVLGLGPIGSMSCRVARQRGIERIIAIDRVPGRLARARADNFIALDLEAEGDDLPARCASRPAGAVPTPSSMLSAWRPMAHGSRRRSSGSRACCRVPSRPSSSLAPGSTA